ncbi:MAG TPA: cyclic nucleotide-binding domain-containing protein [Myxococcales bacterium]
MDTLFDLGIAALKQGHAERALGLLAEAVRRKPSDHRARLAAARALAEMGERERALLALNSAAEGLLRRDYLLSAILAVKLALRFNPAEKMLKQTLRQIHARAVEVAAPSPLPPPLPGQAKPAEPAAAAEPAPVDPAADLTRLRGGTLAEKALEVLLGEDDGPKADVRKRPPLPLFVDLEPEAFVDLVERTTVREYTDKQLIVREGDAGSSVFIIVSGQAKVVAESGDQPRQLATLRGGALFGELSILTGAPRSASIYAVSDVELFEISHDDLDLVSKTHPTVPKALAEFAQKRLAMNLLATAPLFTLLETGHRGPVLQRFRGRIVPQGERVIEEGAPSAGLFLVLSGEFSVTKKDPSGEAVALRVLGDGDVFGEISLLSGGPASASVAAVRRSAIAFLPREAYDELVGSYPQIEDFLVQLSQKRLSANAAAVQPAEIMDADTEVLDG